MVVDMLQQGSMLSDPGRRTRPISAMSSSNNRFPSGRGRLWTIFRSLEDRLNRAMYPPAGDVCDDPLRPQNIARRRNRFLAPHSVSENGSGDFEFVGILSSFVFLHFWLLRVLIPPATSAVENNKTRKKRPL
jgi:hypothetical protein